MGDTVVELNRAVDERAKVGRCVEIEHTSTEKRAGTKGII